MMHSLQILQVRDSYLNSYVTPYKNLIGLFLTHRQTSCLHVFIYYSDNAEFLGYHNTMESMSPLLNVTLL